MFYNNARELDKKIERLEYKLELKKQVISNKAENIKYKFRREITSPKAFVISFCSGFVIGELTKNTKTKSIPEKGGKVTLQQQEPPLKHFLQLTALTYSLMKSWPFKDLLDTRINRENGLSDISDKKNGINYCE